MQLHPPYVYSPWAWSHHPGKGVPMPTMMPMVGPPTPQAVIMSVPYPQQNYPRTAVPAPSHTPLFAPTRYQSTRATNYPMRNTPSRGQPPPAVLQQPQAAPAPQQQVYNRPQTYHPGPLPYFLPPPGQPTRDPSLPPPVTQALLSTYPSRLRTGVTGLVQPEIVTGGPKEREHLLAELERELANAGSGASTPRVDSPAPFNRGGGGGRRGRGGAVNYAEKASDDEDEEEEEEELSDIEEAASDPEDTDYGGGGKRRRVEMERERERVTAVTHGGRAWAGIGTAEHQAVMRAGKLKRRRDDLEKGLTWLGDRAPGDKVRSAPRKTTRHLYISEEMMEKEAGRPEMLVPITVDFDVSSNNPDQQGTKIKDRFLWNVNEPFITPQQFSQIFCEDIGIPIDPYAFTMAELIQAQLDEAQATAEIDVTDPSVSEDDVIWSEDEVEESTSGHASAAAEEAMDDGVAEDDEEEVVEDVKETTWTEADCRIVVNLDVQIYAFLLRDRIEWDLSSSLPPSLFARHYCTELGLTGEAVPLVAHAITDELLKHKKDCLDLGLFRRTHPEEQAKWEKPPGHGPKTTSKSGAKALIGVWRDWWEREEFSPVLMEMTMEEMDKREQERTREARRMMRTLATSKRRR